MTNQYQNILKKECRNLTTLLQQQILRQPLHRDDLIDRALDSLARQRSVLIIGQEGVGKTALIQGIAGRLQSHKDSTHKKLIEIATGVSLSGTKYLGEWESKSESIFKEAKAKKAILYYTDIWNMPKCGSTSQDPASLLDLIRPKVNQDGLLLIGEATPELLQSMQTISGFIKLFDVIQLEPLSADQTLDILEDRTRDLNEDFSRTTLQRVQSLCDQFLPESAGPGPAINLIEQIVGYQQQKTSINEPEELSPQFIEKVFSIYSGLPLFIIDRNSTLKVADIRQWFRERLIGQEEAIESVIEAIVLYKSALHDPTRPIGSFMFVGPTGVGKTELAKALATYLFGSEQKLLRFDMSEFADPRAYKLLIGESGHGNATARLVDPVRQQPFQVILLDELEKGHVNVWDILLQILDDGRLTPPSGKTVSFRNTLIICTSNVGASILARKNGTSSTVGFVAQESAEETIPVDKLRDSLESTFRPEFINRFQYVVPFYPLMKDQVTRIVKKEAEMVLTRNGICERNLAIDISDRLFQQVVEQGYDVRYGARAIKREIQRQIVLPVATYLAEHRIDPGGILKLDVIEKTVDGTARLSTRIKVISTEESRQHERDRKPIKRDDGQWMDADQVNQELKSFLSVVADFEKAVDLGAILDRISELDKIRSSPEFWSKPEEANLLILESEKLRSTSTRLQRFWDQLTELDNNIRPEIGRTKLTEVANRLSERKSTFQVLRRQLLYFSTSDEEDAFVELRPIGEPGYGRTWLAELYMGWAEVAGLTIEVLSEPLSDSDSVVLGVRGPYALGMVKLESGLHQFLSAETENQTVVRVTTAPWVKSDDRAEFSSRRALKKTGQLGGRIRSCSVLAEQDLVLQNQYTLEQNRQLAADLAMAWRGRSVSSDIIVRRYCAKPFEFRDYLTGETYRRRTILMPENFHHLMCNRVDLDFVARQSVS